MYIAIDRESMKWMYKHHDPDVVCNLAWIENQQAALHVLPIETSAFQCFTNMELLLLIGNGHAPEFAKNWNRTKLIEQLCKKAEEFSIADVWVFELATQAKHVPASKGEKYTYAKGANRAAIVDNLFS